MESLLVCQSCAKRYNLTTREPLMLVCCGKTYCKECIETKMKVYKNDCEFEFKCNFCQTDKFRDQQSNLELKSFVEIWISTQKVLITCDEHTE